MLIVIAIGAIIFILVRAPEERWRYVAPPDISRQPLSLRVVYAHNPRFNELTATQLQTVLQHTTALM
ncbi:MAG TPA: hypothetical protein VFY78_12400, partial [Gammaproteobacteria bacterium]|nr:hypothetical protein [Gammaproteobacteria bacterium]